MFAEVGDCLTTAPLLPPPPFALPRRVVVGRRSDRQQGADRLDPEGRAMLRSASGEQPTFAALDFTAAQRDGYSCS